MSDLEPTTIDVTDETVTIDEVDAALEELLTWADAVEETDQIYAAGIETAAKHYHYKLTNE